MNWEVDDAVYWAVNGAMWKAMAFEARYEKLLQVINVAMYGATEKRGEPPHPGLELYLGGVPG